MYIYQMPYFERKKLCSILDQGHVYEELALVHMEYDNATVQEFYRGNSPSDELLNRWSIMNHTVLELFALLNRMKHYQAMTIIKPLVDVQYHRWIKEGEAPLPELRAQDSAKILNVPQICVSRDDNESGSSLRLSRKPKSPLLTDHSVAESTWAIPQITYEELLRATNNWDPKAILGRGGFGTVFRGTWKRTQVAIKRIDEKENSPESNSLQIKQSITELHCLNTYRHDNVLSLYGFSIGGPHPCLVYQYMSGGSLEHRLHIQDLARVLLWPTRLNIAIGTACGLQFLHSMEKPLIHGDIKPANILLDPNDNPRIGDFGLAREGPLNDYIKISRIHGTKPYLPDEFLRGKKFSTKVDTYSFGVVLFEIATGLPAYSQRRENKFLKDHVVEFEGCDLELKDPKASDGEVVFTGLLEIGKMCVSCRARERPEMVNVLSQLESVSFS